MFFVTVDFLTEKQIMIHCAKCSCMCRTYLSLRCPTPCFPSIWVLRCFFITKAHLQNTHRAQVNHRDQPTIWYVKSTLEVNKCMILHDEFDQSSHFSYAVVPLFISRKVKPQMDYYITDILFVYMGQDTTGCEALAESLFNHVHRVFF